MNSSTVAKDSPDTYPLMPTYGQPPVQFVRGSGTELYDREGNRYLDFLCGLAVTSLGHAHPAIAEALAEQARTLLHVSNRNYRQVARRRRPSFLLQQRSGIT